LLLKLGELAQFRATASIIHICMTGILISAFWPPSDEKSTEDFVPRMKSRKVICSVAFGVIDALGQRLQSNQAEMTACLAAFLWSKLRYEEAAVAFIIKELTEHSGKPGTDIYDYILIGGKAASAFFSSPETKLDTLTDAGIEIRPLLRPPQDSIPC
jgi:hypothetical protein